MRYVVIRPVNQLSIVIISRHRTAKAAHAKADELGLKIAVYELVDGDIPKHGEIMDRNDFYFRFRVNP